jgi:hypothetical protein
MPTTEHCPDCPYRQFGPAVGTRGERSSRIVLVGEAPGRQEIEAQKPFVGAAGGLLWASGDLFGLWFLGVLLVQWMRADERDAVRDDRRIDRLVREHREDTSHAAYSARLASLAELDRRRSASTS